jgi:hypothetical protein
MRYSELKNRQRKELNAFPMGFAFTEQQLQKELERLNTTKDNLVDVGAGGFIRSEDKDAFFAMFERHSKEMDKAMEDDSFLQSAIVYELGNHEYCITYDTSAALSALGLEIDTERKERILEEAKKEYWKSIKE